MEISSELRQSGETTWVVVVTKVKAHIFSASGRPDSLELCSDLPHFGGREDERELVSDRAGRADSPNRPGGSPLSPERSAVESSLQHYLREICQLLELKAYRNVYQRLILVADAPLLGRLRAVLGAKTRERLQFEIEKDLTRLTMGELKARLTHVINERLTY